MLLTLSRGPQAAFAVALLTLVLGVVAMFVQPPPEARAYAEPVASLRPPPPIVHCTDDHGLAITTSEVRYDGIRLGSIAELQAGTTRLRDLLGVLAAEGNRDKMAGTWKLTVRHDALVPADVVELVRTLAVEAGFDDLIVVVEGGDHLKMIADLSRS